MAVSVVNPKRGVLIRVQRLAGKYLRRAVALG